jgi:outer membrane lipoprotein-sorting protein
MKRASLNIGLLLLCLMGTSGCLLRTHRVEHHRATEPLLSSTQEELLAKINRVSATVTTMNATVDVDTTVGGEKKGKVIEYQQIRGYILLQKPAMLRMIGLLPIVRNRAFDMVSDGDRFKLSIPPKNRFITGANQITKLSDNTLENLRPQVIYEALSLPPVDAVSEIAFLEEGTQAVVDPKTHANGTQPNYHIAVVRRAHDGEWHLHRKIYFNRADLTIYRQTIYDETGAIATDVHYDEVQDFNGTLYPTIIEIERPKEEYRIAIHMVKLTLNEPLKPEQFQLEPPVGATITELK